jgi:hypothetical protein
MLCAGVMVAVWARDKLEQVGAGWDGGVGP